MESSRVSEVSLVFSCGLNTTAGMISFRWDRVRKKAGVHHTKGKSFYTAILVTLSFGVLFGANHAELDSALVTAVE